MRNDCNSIRFFNLSGAIILILLLSSKEIAGQKCATDQLRKENIAFNTDIINNERNNEELIRNWHKGPNSDKQFPKILTLPVVVHIVWKTEEHNISDEQIYTQLQVLNDDFRRTNANYENTPEEFRALASDTEIEFCLAKLDPTGRPTNGITRTETYVDHIGDTKQYYNSAQGGRSAWDNTRYINIWVCDLGNNEVLGFATAPGTAAPRESDGLVISWEHFGTTGSAAGSAPNHLGRTATHEMGHYLNLNHLWGREKGGCTEDDFVNDTPSQNTFTRGCPDFPYYDICTDQGSGLMYNNFMDYTDDACMTMFTQGQKQRMVATINSLRTSLLFSNVCQLSTSSSVPTVDKHSLMISPNPINNYLNIQVLGQNLNYPLSIQLINTSGLIVRTYELEKNQQIDVSEVPDGLYFLRLSESSLSPAKIVIQH